MQTKIFSAAILFVSCVTIGHAQNEIYHFKRDTAPFDDKTPLHHQLLKALPYTVPYQNKISSDSIHLSYKASLGEVFIDQQDGMPILKPYPQSTYHERTSILNPYLPAPLGKKSYVYPMPNPLNKALIVK